MKTALTVAGFDPSSGAGVTADLLVFAAHGIFGTSCITSLTVQSTLGVRRSSPVDARVVADTLNCLDEDIPAAAIKIGMLGTEAVVEAVSEFLEKLRARPTGSPVVVIDPVLRSSSGRELIDSRGADLLRSRLLPLADWITPNLDELSFLTGKPVTCRDDLAAGALTLQDLVSGGTQARISILAKGGHLETPDDLIVTSGGETHWLQGERVETNSTHGTGCALSSALLCRLLLGDDAVSSARNAKAYVTEALRQATPIGRGRGPMNHLWPLRRS